MIMKFYELVFSHIGGRTFPWASGYGPLSEMPFLEALPIPLRDNMKRYWSVNPSPSGMDIDPGGRSWSHMIGCGLGNPNKFVSEYLIHDLVEAGIPILRFTEMPIASNRAKALQKISPPKYYVLEAVPGIARSWEAMGIPMDENGKPILNPIPNPWPESKYCFSSWNGMDLVSYSDIASTTTLLCTERVKDLAERRNWSNVKFKPLLMVD